MATEERHPTMQGIMEDAYARWRALPKGTSWTLEQFYAQLTGLERLVIPLGNYNYQVENGGHLQWIDNGYAKAAPDVIQTLVLLCQLVNTEASEGVRTLLTELQEIDVAEYDDEDLWSAYGEDLNRLDSGYYALNDQFMDDCEVFFTRVAFATRLHERGGSRKGPA